MANETHKFLTDLMIEINAHRYLQHQTHTSIIGVDYATTVLCVNPDTDSLNILFHDVRQPLVHYVLPVVDFKLMCGLPNREQNENELPEEKAAEAAPSA